MLLRLVLLFTVGPLVELALLLYVADMTSWFFTLGLVILTGVVGAVLARMEGIRCLAEFRRKANRMEVPAAELLDGAMIFLAGTLLVTPGLLTDAVGFAFLIPPLRRAIRGAIVRRMNVHFHTLRATHIDRAGGGPHEDAADSAVDEEEVIDVEFRHLSDSEDRPGDRSGD